MQTIRRSMMTILLVIVAAACNLTAAPPTPTLPPTSTPAPLDLFTQPAPQGTPINSDCPNTPATWIAYTIERGDTFSLLAEQTDSTIVEITAGNCMSVEDTLIIDTIIFLPRVPVISP